MSNEARQNIADEVLEYVRGITGPKPPLREIGERFGISRQRVHQILTKAGITWSNSYTSRTVASGQRICPECGGQKSPGAKTCSDCRWELARKRSELLLRCPECGGQKSRHESKVCSKCNPRRYGKPKRQPVAV